MAKYTDEFGTDKEQRRGPWLLISLVAIATLVAIWLVPGEKQAANPASSAPEPSLLGTGPKPAATAPAASMPAAGKTDSPSVPSPAVTPAAPVKTQPAPRPPPKPALQPGDAARALIRQLRAQPRPDLQRAYAAAVKYRANNDADDAYLLFFYAARNGFGPAAMALAREADPATFKPDGLFDKPDELQANNWYLKASELGVKDAAGALSALRKRVEQQAAQGDEQAQRIMLQWK